MADHVYTTCGRKLPGTASPALLFQKWQAYDRFECDPQDNGKKAFETKASRKHFLRLVANTVQNVVEGQNYKTWFDRYNSTLINGLGVKSIDDYATRWRLLVGYSTNSTLESGVTLHHLYGFPYIPGSAVKGLLHHVAEMLVMEGIADVAGNAVHLSKKVKINIQQSPPEELTNALAYLKLVKVLFGSLHLEQGQNKEGTEKYGSKPPLTVLEKAKGSLARDIKDANLTPSTLPKEWQTIWKDLQWLTGDNTGGLLRFYDAVPSKGEKDLLELDILNPHYPEYYKENSSTPPSDDQSPNPVLFLAVRPGVKFRFYYYSEFERILSCHDDEAEKIKKALSGWNEEKINQQIENWLKTALGEWGIGAKTAAGYGYFNTGLFSYD